jgi:caffeoyl-CoA O-methyltransferase
MDQSPDFELLATGAAAAYNRSVAAAVQTFLPRSPASRSVPMIPTAAVPPRLLPAVAALAVAAALFILPSSGLAAESSEEAAPAADDLEQMRAEFIKNFKRSGLNTTPGDAKFLQLMVEISGAKRGVEVGAATGYGAIHMGMAFERNGGKLITIDISPAMVAATRENLAKVKLEETVEVIEGDALKVLGELEGEFDFVFLDAVKSDYLKYHRLLEPKLKPGAVIVADNVIRSAGAMRDFLDAMAEDPAYDMLILRASDDKNDGMALILKRK